MQQIAILTALILMGLPVVGRAQMAADSAAIRQAALDYAEGWYAGDADRMDRALHPDLAKRRASTHPETGQSILSHLTASMMVEYARAGGGKASPHRDVSPVVTILDAHANVASVKVVTGDFIDYLHVVRWNDGWKILNVLWDPRPQP
ncbi:MAG: nuclear transport factor 2 family protein [Gemmatimonadota bacterium]|nr:nuclear transport factor 2 family protein [Gemmatimonadota bacterium]MDH3367216.1 nuclear transport factor 2 family protein [Gemmatimonadota bacterium]MDH3479597.1 nuclear transport factor 2 family protein [Gemmatimonadota bacterium]MDH3570747.1 nuclear transport factor 2 family protein [Gemmatimonadota bacterium]MDH5548342.1 nuclear transport factor 2 family protein [Gemmatimonadota bacterium]